MPSLRPYQTEDVAAVLRAHQTHRRVIGRGATGLGKACEIAALAQHYAQFGRVMVLVDVKKLVRQLAETIQWFTGIRPGIEMGDEQAFNESSFASADQIVVSTVQTQYSGSEGKERYRKFAAKDYSAVLLDECELFLAPKARSVVDYYLNGNPDLKVFGCTATPLRTDGVAMANLFDAKAFNRDIEWGIDNGWLVRARQAFVRVSLDFSTLSVRKNDEGEVDYSDEEIAQRINNEQTLIELAKGIVHVAENHKSIIVCPNIATAKGVAHYIDAEKPGSARCIYGELPDTDKDDIFAAHYRGDFQFLSSVMMLTKGFDDPNVSALFMCRKTKSKRLYIQAAGRVVRPLKGLVDGIDSATDRIAAIASSSKPFALVANMVGIDGSVRDMTIIDILGEIDDAEINERAKRLVEEDGLDTQEAIDQATEAVEDEREAEAMLAEAEAELADDEDERAVRRRVLVGANIEVEYEDGLGTGKSYGTTVESSIPSRQLEILRRFKVEEEVIARISIDKARQLSGQLIARAKRGLCSYRQAQILRRYGFTREQVGVMSRDKAKAEIDGIAANNWKPRGVAA